ncbi:aldo/keto reductase [Actinoplanes sp. NPDC051494]|uniref:aldo/keto reductase n=1 Tax=Actinoplanes sp. NPDC051494 TaxID=3363907 RepID=UPI00379A7E96
MLDSLEAGLRRLGTDYLDIYWVHIWGRVTPLEETMRALDDVVRAGKVLYVGISDAPARVVARANTLGLAVTAWGPLGRGVLSGRASRPTSSSEGGIPSAYTLGV